MIKSVLIVLTFIAVTSCRKNYTCQCTTKDPYTGAIYLQNFTFGQQTKTAATALCNNQISAGYDECKLKR